LVIDLIIKLGEPLISGFRGLHLKDYINGRIIKGIHAKITLLVPNRDGDHGERVGGSNMLIKSKENRREITARVEGNAYHSENFAGGGGKTLSF